MPRGRLAVLLDTLVFARPYQRIERALGAFGTLLLPASCVVCGAWDTSLCPACLAAFRRATVRPFRAEEGAESLPDVLLPTPQVAGAAGAGQACSGGPHGGGTGNPGYADPPYAPLPVVAAGRYHGAVPAVLLAFKNHGHVDLAAPVAAALAGALHTAMSELLPSGVPTRGPRPAPVLIVPVPTRGSSRRKRGYDPLGLLLDRLRRAGNLPAGTVLLPAVQQVPSLHRVAAALTEGDPARSVRALRSVLLPGLQGGQKGLGRRSRRAQVGSSMRLSPRAGESLRGVRCIVVDDVLTTGATLGEVHRVLTGCGARVLGAVVVAATTSPAGDGAGGPGGRVPVPTRVSKVPVSNG